MMQALTKKRVLVTGGTGLVGGHLTESLVARGAKVHITTRSHNPQSYFAGRSLGTKVVNAWCDITDFRRVIDVVTKYEIEYIFHVAAQSTVTAAYVNPYETFLTNVMGTVHILEAARRSPYIKAVIVASSDKAYGKDCLKATEVQKLAGDHPYEVSKSSADLIALSYYKTYGLPVAVSRFGNIFGPGDLNFSRLIPGIMDAVINQKVLEVRSDGNFTRDYLYVKDVVEGYVLLAEKIDKIAGEAFNFSANSNFSVKAMIEKISSILGQTCQYRVLNNHKNEIQEQSISNEKARRLLAWEPKYSFEEGVKETYIWYKKYFEETPNK
jgi:CDP-glucose 4,6-dehydratase